MSTIARLFDFVPGTIIRSSEVDSEFNQIVNLLNGTTTNIQTFLQLSDATLPTLKVNQTVTGVASSIISLLAAGVEKVKVDGNGRIHSLIPRVSTDPAASIATPSTSAPFVVASTALVLNLNADMIDGLHASDLQSISSGTFLTNITISNTEPYLRFEDTTGSENDVEFVLLNDGTDQQLTLRRVSDQQKIQRWNVDQGTAQFHNVAVLRADAGADVDISIAVGGSVPDQHLTPKLYVDNRKTVWGVGAYFNGVILTTMRAGQFGVPKNARSFTATHLRIIYQLGTLTGNTVVEVRQNGVSIGTGTLTNTATVNTWYINDIADVVLAIDDVISFHCTSAGGHENVTVQIEGTQKVSTN